MIVSAEFENPGVEVDGMRDALEDCALEVIVENDSWNTPEERESIDVPAYEARHGRAEVEAQEDLP